MDQIVNDLNDQINFLQEWMEKIDSNKNKSIQDFVLIIALQKMKRTMMVARDCIRTGGSKNLESNGVEREIIQGFKDQVRMNNLFAKENYITGGDDE